MKSFHLTLSLGRLLTGVSAVAIIVSVASHNTGRSLAATNHAPTGSFTGLSCVWDSSRNDYKYTISAKYSDPDGGAGGGANAYLGSSTSTGNYQGAGTPSASNALDGTSHDGPSYTWTFYRATLTDSKWPVQLFVDDVGTSPAVWRSVAKTGKPSCPAQPAPPAPVSTPKPAPVTSAPTTSTRRTTTGTTTHTTPAAPAAAPPGSDANGTTAVGTIAATITIPAEGAAKLHISYTETGGPAVSSDDQAVSGDNVVISLNGLDAHADYSYQIIRTNAAGASSTSPAASFTTKGYTVRLAFLNDKKKPVSGVSASINDPDNSAAKSDKDGKLSFGNLPDGSYTVAYTYQGKAYTKDFNTADDTSTGFGSDGAPQAITLSNTVNVDKLGTAAAGQAAGSGHGNTFLVVLGILFVLALLAGGIWYLLGVLKRRRLSDEYGSLGTGTDAFDQLPQPPSGPTGTPLPTHAGESLRDMVVESMREQHQLPQQQPATDPFAAAPVQTPPPAAPEPYTLPVTPVPQPPTPAPGPTASQPAYVPTPLQPMQENADGSETLQIPHER